MKHIRNFRESKFDVSPIEDVIDTLFLDLNDSGNDFKWSVDTYQLSSSRTINVDLVGNFYMEDMEDRIMTLVDYLKASYNVLFWRIAYRGLKDNYYTYHDREIYPYAFKGNSVYNSEKIRTLVLEVSIKN